MDHNSVFSYYGSVAKSGPPDSEIIKPSLCPTQLSTNFIMLTNFKMPTIVGILTFISMINTTPERLKARTFFNCRYFSFYAQSKFRAQLSWACKKFYNLRTWCVTRSATSLVKGVKGGLGVYSLQYSMMKVTGTRNQTVRVLCLLYKEKKTKELIHLHHERIWWS